MSNRSTRARKNAHKKTMLTMVQDQLKTILTDLQKFPVMDATRKVMEYPMSLLSNKQATGRRHKGGDPLANLKRSSLVVKIRRLPETGRKILRPVFLETSMVITKILDLPSRREMHKLQQEVERLEKILERDGQSYAEHPHKAAKPHIEKVRSAEHTHQA